MLLLQRFDLLLEIGDLVFEPDARGLLAADERDQGGVVFDGELGQAIARAAIAGDEGIVLIVGAAGLEGGCDTDGSRVWLDVCWVMASVEWALVRGWGTTVLVVGQRRVLVDERVAGCFGGMHSRLIRKASRVPRIRGDRLGVLKAVCW